MKLGNSGKPSPAEFIVPPAERPRLELSQLRESAKAFEKALEINPRHYSSHYNLALVYIELFEFERASSLFQKACRLEPDQLLSWYNLGTIELLAGSRRKAKTAYRRVHKLCDETLEGPYLQALAFYNLNQIPQALSAWNNACEVLPEYGSHFALLGRRLEIAKACSGIEQWPSVEKEALHPTSPITLRPVHVLPILVVGAGLISVQLTKDEHSLEQNNPDLRADSSKIVASNTVATKQDTTPHIFQPQSKEPELDAPKAADAASVKHRGAKKETIDADKLRKPWLSKSLANATTEEFVPSVSEDATFSMQPEPVYSMLEANVFSMAKSPYLFKKNQRKEPVSEEPKPTISGDKELPEKQVKASPSPVEKEKQASVSAPMPGRFNAVTPLFWSNFGQFNGTEDKLVTDYNFKIGPMAFKMKAYANLDYNDNVALSSVDKRSAVILTTGIQVNGSYPLTEFNTLTLDLDINYQEYFNDPSLDTFNILLVPGSDTSAGDQFQFEILMDQLTLRFYDRISLTNDAFKLPALSGFSQFTQFTNTFGLGAEYDLSDVVLKGDVHRSDIFVMDTPALDFLDRHTYELYLAAEAQYRPWLLFGVQGNYTISEFDRVRSDSTVYSFGPYVDLGISDNINTRVEVSRSVHKFDAVKGSNIGEYVGSVSLTHQINELMSQNFVFSKSVTPGVTRLTNYVKNASYAYSFNWKASRKLGTYFMLNYLKGTEERIAEFQRWDFVMGASYSLSPGKTVGASYGYANKRSDDDVNNYKRNLLGVSFNYDF